MKESIQNTSQS